MAKLLSTLIFILILSGCGAKGALYLPKNDAIQKNDETGLDQKKLSGDEKINHSKQVKEKDA